MSLLLAQELVLLPGFLEVLLHTYFNGPLVVYILQAQQLQQHHQQPTFIL
jgi:hypothetical protein